MSKKSLDPKTALYPLPVVLVSTRNTDGKVNAITIAWTGIINSEPPMLGIGVRKSRHSYQHLVETGEFVVNIPDQDLAYATDYCGIKSGKKVDKFKELNLTAVEANLVKAPLIKEAPINIECQVKKRIELGSHDYFMAEIVMVHADEGLFDQNGKLNIERANLIAYGNHQYFTLGEAIGKFGYSQK